jgi:ribosome-binding factor A
MSEKKDTREKEIIREAISQYILRESNGSSLITVTRIELSQKNNKADILVSILPEHKEEAALDFLKRQRGEMRNFLMKNTKIAHVPTLDVKIDYGEKNRQKIDRISEASK